MQVNKSLHTLNEDMEEGITKKKFIEINPKIQEHNYSYARKKVKRAGIEYEH